MTSLLRLARRLRSEDGIALPTVFGLGLVMLMLVAGSMSVVTNGITKTATDEDFNGALTAAYAGIEEYQSRLANDATYQKYGNPSAPFTTGTGSTVTLPSGAATNAAFGIGTSGTWAFIPTAGGGNSTASYRYEIDNSDYQDKGVLHLRSTGRVGDITRSIVADLKQDGFIDYLWFTNYEVSDPAYTGRGTIDTNGKNTCERYAYGSPARSDATCGTIQFGTADVFGGPVRSNDRMRICQSTFHGPVITSSPTTPSFLTPGGCSAPTFNVGTGPTFASTIDMPPTNTELKKETRNDLATEVPRPGCLYTGPTVITLLSNGKMNIISPWTKKTNIAATVAAASNPTQCGTPGTGTDGLGSSTGATIDVLDLNLIYVQAVPAVGSADANAPATAAMPSTSFTCTNANSGANLPAGWQFMNGATTIARFPVATEITPSGASALVHYNCRGGDAYLKGVMNGQMTVAAENYIYVTGDVTYLDKQSDMLGLVGTNAVYVWNPVSSTTGTSLLAGVTNREIDAAILSVAHTFQVQNYDRGMRGTLTIFGAIAQKFRGSVGVAGTAGYTKNYQYDTRFRNTAPPKFLTPVSTTYGVTQFATVPAAFLATGATAP